MNAVLLTLALTAFQQQPMDRIITQLGSELLQDRASAQSELLSRWQRWSKEDLDQLRAAADSPDEEIAARCRTALAEIGLRREFPLIPAETWARFSELRALIRGGDPEEIGRLLREMEDAARRGEIPLRALLPAALEFVEDKRDSKIGTGCWSMGREDTFNVKQLARGLIWDAAPALAELESREEARAWWKSHGPKTDREWNLDGLVHKDDWVRTASVVRLARLKDPALTTSLFESIRGIHNEYGFAQAIKSLFHLPPQVVLSQLQGRLNDEDFDLRRKALELISEVDDPRSQEILIETIEDPAQRVGEYYGAVADRRMCDIAGQHLAKLLQLDGFEWPKSVRGRDHFLEAIRNDWRTSKGLTEAPLPGLAEPLPLSKWKELLPDLVHDSPQRRARAQDEMSRLGPGAWRRLRLELPAFKGPAAQRLKEASGYLCQTVQSITALDDEARAFALRIQPLMHRHFDFETFHSEVLAAWFEDPTYAELSLTATREEDGRGISLSLAARKCRSPETETWGFWVWNLGSGALWTWDRVNFDEEMRKQFSKIVAAGKDGPDGQAGLVLKLIKVDPDRESLAR